jgi:hypothetical protein
MSRCGDLGHVTELNELVERKLHRTGFQAALRLAILVLSEF